jgi:hypothetical protein
MRTALRRNTHIAAWAFGIVAVIVVGLVVERRYAARTPPAEDQTKLAAEQLADLEGATGGSSESPATPAKFESSASAADSTAAKPVVISVVKPWIDIARMPQYVQGSSAERMTIRDLYWRICVEEKIPLEQRTSGYWQFVRKWNNSESGAAGSPTGATSAQLLRGQQPRLPSPVDAVTMRRWCEA